MNVLSRKMFQKARSRPARDALNKAGGIMSSSPELMDTVQMFQSGGNVFSLTGQRQFGSDGVTQRIPTQPFPEIDFTDIQMTAPKLTTMPPMKKGVAYGGPFGAVAFEKQLLNLQKQSSLYPDKPFVGKIEDPEGKGFPVFEGGKLQGFTTAMEFEVKDKPGPFNSNEAYQKGLESLVTNRQMKPSDYLPNFYSPKPKATVGGEIAEGLKSVASVPGGIVSSVADLTDTVLGAPGRLDLDKVTPTGVELADLTGSGVGREDTPFRRGEITKGAPLAGMIEEQRQEQERTDRVLGEQDRMQQGQINVDPASSGIQAEIEALNIAMQDKKAMQNRKTDPSLIEQENRGYNAMLDTMTQAERDADITADAATTGEEGDLGREEPTADVDKNQVSDVDLDILREEGRMQQGQISRSGENLANSVETGNKDALTSQLKDLMAQFTSNAPKYEGIDKGMAMMKIGFAMAAGKSPYAMQNIANALSSGADMFIKDKSKKDAFNRQVNLSALQYGLGEIGKDKAQSRADARSFTDFVDEDGNTVRVSAADYFNNGNKLPKGLQDKLSYTAIQKGILEREKATIIANSKLKELSRLTPTQQTDLLDDYKTNVKKASEAETAGTLLETVMMNADNIVGAGPALRQTGADFLAVFGIDAPKGWNDQALSVQDLKAALQSVVPATLGSTQSANSISNRDVELLIAAFLQEGIMTGENGNYSFLTTSREKFNNSLKNGLSAVRRSQAEALNSMSSIEQQLTYDFTTTSGRVGTELLKPLQSGRKGALFGATAAEGFTPTSLTLGKDNIWDIT